jgi:hypothetical protein
MNDIKYQLVLLGQEKAARSVAISGQVSKLFADLGLDFAVHGELLTGASRLPEWEGFPVAVWFGGAGMPDADEVKVVDEFLARGFAVFPVVKSLLGYKECVPTNLHPINGQEFSVSKVANDIMLGFRLARRHRQAFISYKRSESAGVASQLFHELSDRGYRVFLDTASVEAGVNFQNALWSRMADVDLLILLDTPNALKSEWVHKELNRAHDLGMAVVQLIWPNHKRSTGTELSAPLPLKLKDFVGKRALANSRLQGEALGKIVDRIESERIRSLNSRRTRVVDVLTTTMSSGNFKFIVHPAKHLDVMRDNSKLAEVIPFVGVPDSTAVHEHDRTKQYEHTVVVYNGLGVDEEWATHIKWLKQRAVVEIFPTDDFGKYLERFSS